MALKTLSDNSVDSVVTDPPYGLEFMGKEWDKFNGNRAYAEWVEKWARECLRVLKPGGHLLAFSGTRTYHALAWGVEGAGFEIRDMIEWLYLSGFPKSMDVGKQFDKMAGAEREVLGPSIHHSEGRKVEWGDGNKYGTQEAKGKWVTSPTTDLAKQWDGWGTALKPAHEPIVVARRPFSGTVAANVEQYGAGAINVDGCRIGEETTIRVSNAGTSGEGWGMGKHDHVNGSVSGRFPANCVTTDDGEWYSPYFNVTPQEISKKATKKDRNSDWQGNPIDMPERDAPKMGNVKHRLGSCPVHHVGLRSGESRYPCGCEVVHDGDYVSKSANHHPTVKPASLMAWLVRLVTPPNGIVLDPFAGSGSTLVAARREGFSFIGIEREAEYVEITSKRAGVKSSEGA